VGADWWLSIWSSDRPIGNKSADHDVDYYLVGYTGLSIAAVVLTFFKSICIALCCLRGAKLLHIRMLRRVIEAPMRFFDTTPIGRVLNRMSSDTSAIDSNLPSKFLAHKISFIHEKEQIKTDKTIQNSLVYILETPRFITTLYNHAL
jgi:ABC-type multidrug transport system fused ATPase/permease subunit